MSYNSVTINKFIGMDKTRSELNLKPGQLILNNNYRYEAGGGLKERGGGAKLTNAPSAGNPVYGAHNYQNNAGSEYLITAQATDLYYYDSGWNALGLTLTANQRTRFESAGFDADRAVYAVNQNENVVKIYMSGATPTADLITTANGYIYNAPTGGTFLKLHKNRLWIALKDGLVYSDVLDFDAINPSNSIKIYPGKFGFIKALAVWGDALFIFKEFGVFVIPNADDATPANWVVLKANAITGTQSPDSVVETKIGLFYFASDNKVRLIAPNISFSSGEYTLGGSGSPVMSHDIEEDIDMLLDDTQKDDIAAIEKDDEYIFGFKSVNNSSVFNDRFYFCDVTKFHQIEGIAQPQPYWGEYTGFDYNFFAKQTVSGKVQLYGWKGLNGETHETLNEGIHNDAGGAISAYGVLAWLPIGGAAVEGKLQRIVFVGETENWEIDLKIQSHSFDKQIPETGTGITKTFTVTNDAAIGVVGTAIVGTSTVGSLKGASKRYRIRIKGNYFRIEFSNANANEFHRIQEIIMYYENVRSK